jgi:hypothetical protein
MQKTFLQMLNEELKKEGYILKLEPLRKDGEKDDRKTNSG